MPSVGLAIVNKGLFASLLLHCQLEHCNEYQWNRYDYIYKNIREHSPEDVTIHFPHKTTKEIVFNEY